MATSKLHIICGNCGCADMFVHYTEKDFIDYGHTQEDAVIIKCKNCSTLHVLSDYIPAAQE